MAQDYGDVTEMISSVENNEAGSATEGEAMPQEAAPEPAPAAPQRFKYQANGREVEEPIDMILKRASQGYNYAQRMAEFKQERERYTGELDGLKKQSETLSKWKQFDEYAVKNPTWAQHVEEMWAKKDQFSNPDIDPNDPVNQRFAEMEKTYGEKLSRVDKFLAEQEAQKQQAAVAAVDSKLSKAISSVQEKYKDIDFATADETGQSLENRILQHAIDNEIGSFEAAFKDYYWDQLTARERDRALSEKAASTKGDFKAGIVARTAIPSLGAKAKLNPRNSTYEGIYETIIKDYNLGG